MAIDIKQVRKDATDAVLKKLTAMYKDADPDNMRTFAEAIAESAVAAVEHVISDAEVTGGRIR